MFTPSALSLLFLAGQVSAPPKPPAAAQTPDAEARPKTDGPVIAIETTMGTIQVGLYASKAPLSTRNIMNYVKNGHYVGTTFHRVIPGVMIQGGGMDAKLVEKPTSAPVRNEARNGLTNTRGSLALARTSDPHSATSQFFISVKDNPALDFGISRDGWGYAVFGEVLSGIDVVDQIVAVPTSTQGPFQNVPITPVLIKKVTVVSEPAAPKAAPAPAGSAPSAKPTVRPPDAAPKAAAPKAAAPKAAPSSAGAAPANKPKPKPSATPQTS